MRALGRQSERSQYAFEAGLAYVASSQSSQGYTVKPCPESVILLCLFLLNLALLLWPEISYL